MRTTQLLLTGLLILGNTAILKAQATQGTNAISSTSYLGTSNNNDVIFKRQAINAGLIATNKTSFGLNSFASTNSVSIGSGAGQFSTGSYNTYLGSNSGKGLNSSTLNSGMDNVNIGYNSGTNNTTGSSNVFIGSRSGEGSMTSFSNVFLGVGSGQFNLTGYGNSFIGSYSGQSNNGSRNLFIGESSCQENTSGINNTALGYYSGFDSNGSNNVFIGFESGFNSIGDNKLFIENSSSNNPLIWGDFGLDLLKFNGKVGIGGNTTNGFGNLPLIAGGVNLSSYSLFVKGGILTEELRVALQGTWADYVFEKDYKLPTLDEVEKHIKENGHLINVPSAKEVKKNGINLGEMTTIQQEKIEELTLYIIEQNKINEKQSKEIEELKIALQSLLDKKQ